ncbi:hypothetical protein WJX75_006341 [Coccomyxa subellipsoidea]|uniref:Uncharacterized protein n=1 Tax=Coccomyxa subellipsoidea TaxID=248742 RepID=A0ABR2YAQ4_9CHLO
MPQFLLLSELGPERGTIVSPKHCQHPVLRVTAGTQLRWRKSSVRPKNVETQIQTKAMGGTNNPINSTGQRIACKTTKQRLTGTKNRNIIEPPHETLEPTPGNP